MTAAIGFIGRPSNYPKVLCLTGHRSKRSLLKPNFALVIARPRLQTAIGRCPGRIWHAL
jgi:hypothetical protein